MSDWQPAASIKALKARSELLQSIRAFFQARDYLEVDTPVLCRATVTDPNIDSIPALSGRFGDLWLQTSPEFAMKRLLAAGSGPIFQFAHAFREGEAGRWHNPEFTLLEWYVPGYDHSDLMQEIESLFQAIAPPSAGQLPFARRTYQQCFSEALNLDPFNTSTSELRACAQAQGIQMNSDLDKDGWQDLLMGYCVGPTLGQDQPCFVTDYPASQAALARIQIRQPAVASRFELYWQGLEIANGFHELADANEQRQRFETDLIKRSQQGKATPRMDHHLLAALQSGLPDCAGVALGLDRLLALLLAQKSLTGVLAFPIDRI